MAEDPPTSPELESVGRTLAQRLALEEFLIDVFGGLVPGVAFLAGFAVCVFAPLLSLVSAIDVHIVGTAAAPYTLSATAGHAVAAVKDLPTAFSIGVMIFVLLLAYVTGLLFYRLDPSKPDRSSFNRMSKAALNQRKTATALKQPTSEDAEQEVDDEAFLLQELACRDAKHCEYPYAGMIDYLRHRKLSHLYPFASQHGLKGKAHHSKSYIMSLKVRLRFEAPDRFGTLIRIESHIRLHSSMWYVSRRLLQLATAGVLVTMLAVLIPLLSHGAQLGSRYTVPLIYAMFSPLLILWLASVCQKAVEQTLHHQRVREVLYVYEMAWSTFSKNLDRLSPPFSFTANESNTQDLDASARPNPSVEARPNGGPLGPPPGCAYPPSGRPSSPPLSLPHLER